MDTRSTRPSLTAALVAFARGAASHPALGPAALRDDAARALLPAPFAWALPRGEGVGDRALQAALRVVTGGLVDHLALRSAAIDAAVRDAVAAGARQLVILGAGLDARAHRMPELADVTVFEVDHPASQTYKRARAARLERAARSVTYVSVDFSSERVETRLAACGHDAAAPTAWVCEGVTMYLTEPEVLGLLDQVAGASAPGSTLALTYRSAAEVPFPDELMRIVGASLAAVGEPFRAALPPEAIAAWLGARGFTVLEDGCSVQWARSHPGSSGLARLLRSERLVVASRSIRASASATPP